ncbi:MAG: hypothetical protein MUO43_06050, partial [Desulfobacterales bacterium]|nr:hypothetical protein [Desulfobacterales bacterium]
MTARSRMRLICVMIVALILIGAGAGLASSEKILKIAFIAPPPVWGPIADFYAKEVAKIEPGLQIKWFGGGQLGPLPKNFAEMKMGKLDM